ncbi:MAG TPA: hypothetical protein VGD90_12520 [Sphingobacteriaceae bacterium]
MEWNYLVIVLCSLLAVILIWVELSRKNKGRLGLRLVCTLGAVISLACLALPIHINRNLTVEESLRLVVLTEGTDPDTLQHYLEKHPARVFTTHPELAQRHKQLKPQIVSGIDHLLQTHPNHTLEIFGYGLEQADLKHLSNRRVIFRPSAFPEGILTAHWEHYLDQGQKLNIQGRYHNSSNRKITLLLKAFNRTVDSTTLGKGETRFHLTFAPKHSGQAVYTLLSISGTDTLSKDPVPVVIREPKPLNVLMLAASPNFEHKFLKNWLQTEAYPVATRTRISKDKFDKSFINLSPINLNRITANSLAQFDVVLSDQEELSALSPGELSALQTAIEKGIGLIVQADTVLSKSFYSRYFPILPGGPKPEQQFSFAGGDPGITFKLQGTSGASIRLVPGTQPLVTDKQRNILVSRTLMGSGTILVSTVQNSYQLMMAGQTKQYTELWSKILDKAARKQRPAMEWRLPFYPRKGEPAEVQLSSSNAGVPGMRIGNTLLAPTQNPHLHYHWQGTYWPEEIGWTNVSSDDSNVPGFIYSSQDWKTLKYYERLHRTSQLASNPAGGDTIDHKTITEKRAIPQIYFFLALLLFCGILWYETKIL